MQDTALEHGRTPDFDVYLERLSALELARRSLLGAPVYTVVSLIMLVGTPVLLDSGWLAAVEGGLLVVLGAIRVLFALGFERRYDRLGERAVVQFSILTALQSLTLGFLAAMVIWQYWPAQEAVLTIVLSAGCIAAGTSALSVRRSAQLIFLVCVLLPFGISVYLVGGLAKALLILGFLFLMGFLVQDGGHAKRTYMRHLKEHYEDQMNLRRSVVENQAKKQFLADIGHEIRTPASSIIGVTSLLLEQDLDPRSRSLAEVIRKRGETLIDLVDNIPGSVNASPRRQATRVGHLNLRKCALKVMELYRFIASGKGLSLTAQLDGLPDSVIFAHEEHLKEVLANLLANAVDHTEQGSITLQASCRPLEDGDLCVEFCVSDTGPGIPEDYLGRIFDPFNTKGPKTSGKFGGGGLGLPLCKGLVELMGGEIEIDSTEGLGTTARFTIRSQRDPSDSAAQTPKPAAENAAATRPEKPEHLPRVLIVDDDEIHREILRGMLEKLGFRPDEAVDGQEAVVAAINGEYNLIFMDLRMPDMDGVEAHRWIHEHFEGKIAPKVVALTGDASREAREECARAGIGEFIVKPLDMDTLQCMLQVPAVGAPETATGRAGQDRLQQGAGGAQTAPSDNPDPLGPGD